MDDRSTKERIEIPTVIFPDQTADGHWLRFDQPKRVLIAQGPAEVVPCLQEADAALAQGSYLAGFISYEAASGLERAYQTSNAYRMPLLWLGVFSAPTLMKIPALPAFLPKLKWKAELTAVEHCQDLMTDPMTDPFGSSDHRVAGSSHAGCKVSLKS